jgi:hypothetical protein
VLASSAVTVTVYVPGTVAGVRLNEVCPFLVVSAWEVAVTTMLLGRPEAMVGAVNVTALVVGPTELS